MSQAALQGNTGALNAVAGCLWHARGIALLEDLGASLSLLPVEGDACGCGGGVEDALRGEGDLGANPVARDDGDGVSAKVAHLRRIAISAKVARWPDLLRSGAAAHPLPHRSLG